MTLLASLAPGLYLQYIYEAESLDATSNSRAPRQFTAQYSGKALAMKRMK
jgi:hypothetical protein